MAQLHTYIEARLGRWSVWYHWGKRPGPERVVSWYEKMIMAPNVQGRGNTGSGVCPVDEAEAVETQKAVNALDQKHYAVVVECYLKWGTVEQKAKALGCCPKTFYNRLEAAHVRLLDHCNTIAAGLPLPSAERPEIPVATKRFANLHKKPYISAKLA